MRLIDADEFKRENERMLNCDFPYISEETLGELIDKAPTVDTATVNAVVCVPYEALMEPSLCEAYVKSMIANNIAHELVKHIEIRSFDSDLLHMMKEFRARAVIVTGTKMDEVNE